MRAALALCFLALASCSTFGGHASIQPIGKDSFTVRALSPSLSQAKEYALSAANAHCAKNNNFLQLLNEDAGPDTDGNKYYQATFYCLPQTDSDYIRFKPQPQLPQPITHNP
ncbi:MAG: hypothetical protein GC129_03420 [Proteobacteria bacterium]|nr:hypothetical protein [Pseudomonadota bacterium]